VLLELLPWRQQHWLPSGAGAVWIAWVGFWWWVFLWQYLRLRRAAMIVGVLMVPVVLLNVVVGVGLFLLAVNLF
jgi:hypothetical protein